MRNQTKYKIDNINFKSLNMCVEMRYQTKPAIAVLVSVYPLLTTKTMITRFQGGRIVAVT